MPRGEIYHSAGAKPGNSQLEKEKIAKAKLILIIITGRMKYIAVSFALIGCCLAMDLGKSGVYDSPMANDYYVR